MKRQTYIGNLQKRCHALVLAGILGAGVLMPVNVAFGAGPGESSQGAVISPVGPGGSTEGQASAGPGASPGPGGTGAANTTTPPTSTTTTTNSNPNAWKKVNGTYQMPDGSAIQNVLLRGIDVSRWQGDIDWKQVASDDVSFVMLGTRSKGAVDPYFHTNIQKASAAGIKVGVYIYSLATTVDMAVEEANFVLDLIHDYPVSYPVAFDMEDSTQGVLSKGELADIANAFCKQISAAGYYPIIYANENWLSNKLDMSLMDYPVWVARYSARPSYANPVMWQATSTGSVKGISGNVDIDFQFRDFSSVIPANTWRTVGGKTYYYQNYVKQKNAWANDNGTWYYMDRDGLASKGWITLSGKSYYLDETTGKMFTGWRQENGKWYYLGSSGAMATGWIDDGGAWYYANSDGVMQTGWLETAGTRYFLKSSGAMATGWVEQSGKWYYLGSSGALAKGWINDGGTWYYSDSDGVMQTGWHEESAGKYFLRGSGAMATGWREMDGAWYYFDGSGRMATGLTELGGVRYYLDESTGRMAANTTLDIGGVSYTAAADGSLSQTVSESDTSGESQSPGTEPVGEAAPAGPGQTGDIPQTTGPGQSGSGDVVITPIGN